MAILSEARAGAVRRLIELAPDHAIRRLETALSLAGRGDGAMAAVQGMVAEEMLDRRVRAAVFAPVAPLCRRPPDQVERLTFPPAVLGLTWAALKRTAPDMIGQAQRAFATLRAEDETPEVFDALCRRAAEGLAEGEAAFAPALEAAPAPLRPRYVEVMALAPLARQAIRRLPHWVRTLSSEHAAGIRVAFRDAVAVGEDAGPPFMELLFGHLEQPFEVLRLISLVMDKPGDRYLAGSELATFGERLLKDIDRRIEAVRSFDPERGLEGGVQLAQSVQVATLTINEFETWLSINREGPWGSRLHAQMRALAAAVEARLREVEPAVAAALPLQPSRSKAMRGRPRLTEAPDRSAVTRAHALLGFLYESRHSASYGGFGVVRSKVVEAVDPRIDQYADDLLEQLHEDPAEGERVRERLEIAADFLGLVRDPRAAEIVRRRAAAASSPV